MGEKERIKRLSKRLSWLLRHGARETGLTMDAAGWAPVAEVLEHLRVARPALEQVVTLNDKARLQLVGEQIRATQGHSLEGAPVTLEALEASWTAWTSDAALWHGTRSESVAPIAREGILPIARTHVHLAASLESRVGKRYQVGVMLQVSPRLLRERGIDVFASPNGVILVRRVPPECITGLQPISKRARAQERELRGLLGLS